MSELERVLSMCIDLILDMLDQPGRTQSERDELRRELAELERLIPNTESEVAA